MPTKLHQLKTYILKDQISNAITALLELTQGRDYEKTVILQSANYNRLQREINSGLISAENVRLEQARINHALLYIIDKLEEELPTAIIDKFLNKTSSLSSEEVSPKDRSYNLANIHQLLDQSLNDSELETFCMLHFEKVHNGFGLGQSKNQKINALLDYAKRYLEMEKLLKLMQTENPARYDMHKPYF